jgi:Ca-activated chloride channel homolog
MSLFQKIDFAHPGLLYLLFIVIPLVVYYILKQRNFRANIRISTIEPLISKTRSYKEILRHVLFAFRIIVIMLIIIALARPQKVNTQKNINTMGIDIMLALDISGTMLARDFKPDRMGAAKNLAIEFINGRPDDRIGVVVFSGESFTQCPLTTDHAALVNLISQIQSGMVEDGTAIGVGLATAVKRLKDSDAASKVIILLTDGQNNMGSIDPEFAAELAKKFNIRVYTIGIGTNGMAPMPAMDFNGNLVFVKMPVDIDETTLKDIAGKTGGQYFRATGNTKLRQVYTEIDKLEKSKISVKQYYRRDEAFMSFVWIAIVLILLDLILSHTLLRSIP